MKDQSFRESKAIKAVKAGQDIKAAAHTYNVSRHTLSDRIHGKLSKVKSAKERRLLDNIKDRVLQEFIYHNIELGFPPIIEMIERAAGEILQRKKAR
jgi:hypothetical protein